MRRVLVLVLALGLLAPASAAAFWQYRGHVHDRKRTTIQFVVRHQGGRPHVIDEITTGRLELACQHGATERHFPGGLGITLDPDGAFSILGSGSSSSVGPGGIRRTHYRFAIRGTVMRAFAGGFLRLETNNHGPRGKCDSGLLRWRAEFVPRA